MFEIVNRRTASGVLAGLLFSSCGGNFSMNPFQDSPASVVKKMYMSCNTGEYSKAKEQLTVGVQRTMDGELVAMGGGFKKVCDTMTKDGTIESIDIKSENIRGEGAVVVSDIHYKDKTTSLNNSSELIKENGTWKVAK